MSVQAVKPEAARNGAQETYMTVYMNIWYLGQVPDGGMWLILLSCAGLFGRPDKMLTNACRRPQRYHAAAVSRLIRALDNS